MKKQLIVILILIAPLTISAQVNVINSTNGSLTITPKGIRSKLPTSISEDTTNIAIGENALQNNVNAKGNVAIGKNALKTYSFNNGGTPLFTQNTAIGYESLMNTQGSSRIDAGSANTALGFRTLKSNTTGNENTAIGSFSLNSNTTGYENIALGLAGLPLNTTGYRNIAIGTIALYTNKANNGSIAIGHLANQYADDRDFPNGRTTDNISIGTGAMIGQSPASSNVGINNLAIGSFALGKYSSGSQNVAIGNGSAANISTGTGNIMIGYKSGGTTNVSNKLFINNSMSDNPLIKGDFSTGELKINSKLKVGGPSDIPSATLHVEGNYVISGKTILSSDQHNFNLNGKSVIKVGGVAGINCRLTGIAGGTDGMLVHIYVTQDINFIISNESALSNAGNRIITGTNTQLEITGDGGVTLIYDGDENVWRVISWNR